MNATLRLTRRQFAATAAGMSLLAAPLRPRASAQGLPPAWTPGDGLRLAGPLEEPASLDPSLARDLPTTFLLRQVFRGLVRFDDGLNPVPELAERIDVSPDGLTYRAVLRDGARFHNGRRVEAEDVRESLSRALRPTTGAGSALPGSTFLGDIAGAADVLSGAVEMLTGVVAFDTRTVEITLSRPSATFLMKLASVPASVIDRHDPVGEDVPSGSGPFRVASRQPEESITLAAAGTWWRGAPAVSEVLVRTGISASQPLNLYQAGEIDLVDEVPPDLASLVADDASGIEVGSLIRTDRFAVAYIALGNSQPPLDDREVRRALRLAFPAGNVARATFNGTVPEATGLIPDGMLGRTWTSPPRTVDVDAARAALRRSRYGSAERVPPIAIYGADVAPLEALRDTVGTALGLTIEVIAVAWPDFLAGLAARRFPAYTLYWGVDYPDPENLLWTLFGSDSPENYTGYRNAGFDAALASARGTLDPDQRAAIYASAHRLLLDDAAVIPLYFDRQTTLARAGIGGLSVTPMGIMSLEMIGAAT
jgi:ABC-type transport system substrate-binding protein